MGVCLWAQNRKKLFVCMLFVTRACYINSHFVHSIVELNSHNVNYILTLFPCCFITYCATRIFQPVHAAKFFEFRILFDKYDVSKGFYRVGSIAMFDDSIVECQLYTYPYFPVVSVYHALCNRYFSSGALSKSF